MSDAENKSLREQTSKALEAKANALMTLSGMESDKLSAERRADSVNEELRRLKLVCSEMELNAEDLERLVDELEKQQETHASDRKELENRVSQLQSKTERLEASLHAEHSQRQARDERNERTKQSLQAQLSSHRSKEENLHHDLEKQHITIERLRKQVQQHEADISHLDKERRSVKVRLSQAEEDIRKLKEEASTWKTQVNNLKAANCRLQTDLELLVEQLEQVTDKKHFVENTMENLVLTREQEQYKSEQTLSQQSKLIDFLQHKYEAPMKKKWTSTESGSKLFSHKKEGQRDEFVQALESERSRSRRLEDKVKDLKTELFHTKVSSFKGSRDLSTFTESVQDTPRPDPVGYADSDDSRSSYKTMKHNIPHRLSLKMNTRATKCSVCQQSVRFGQPAAKCQECLIVTHERCKDQVTPTCGLPSQFMQLYAKTLEKKSLNTAGGVLEADLRLVELGGWMKVQGLDRKSSGWLKRFVLLEKGALSFYLSDDGLADACEYIDLNSYTSVSLISDVNPAELQSIASPDDMPYIIKLELRSAASYKLVYLLMANFTEKEKWDSTLEAIVERGCMADVHRQETRLMGNRLLQLDKDTLSEVNCTTLLGENDVLLLGAEQGLYACQLSYTSQPLIQVSGVSSVYQIHTLTIPGQLLFLSGQDRRLCVTSYAMLKDKLSDRQSTISGSVSMITERVGSMKQCTMFSCSELDNRCTIAAATADYIFVISYSNTNKNFTVRQQVAIDEPCSCICYTPGLLLFGTDTVYKLTINNGCIRPFLKNGVKENTSYDSLPIDILSVGDGHDGQFLCCFTDVGVFVNSSGERSRTDVIQWAGLPLSFAYRAPYLYIIYYKALQVIGLLDGPCHAWNSNQTFLNIPSPRYLGPAYTDGAVYVASLQDTVTDIVVFKGNLTSSIADSESGSDTQSVSSSEFSYVPRKKTTPEFYHRNNKENHPRNQFPTMIQRYQVAALRTGILPSRQQNGNSSASSSSSSLSTSSSSQSNSSSSQSNSSSSQSNSSSSQSSKSRAPVNLDYFNHMYGAGRKKAGSHTTPQHSNV